MNETKKLISIFRSYELNNYTDDVWNWLDHLNPSQAFVVCLGAGPWRIERRSIIQQRAVDLLGSRDLCELDQNETLQLPLEWQRQKLQAMIKWLQNNTPNMNLLTFFLRGQPHDYAIKLLYKITQTKGRAKVLDLFARDYLKIDAFPIDRWVKRKLQEYGLPISEGKLIQLCREEGINPRYFARMMVSDGNFTGNYVVKTSSTHQAASTSRQQ